MNPATVTYFNYLYSAINFNFVAYSISSLINNPSLWAQQVGGANDQIIGFTLYTRLFNNNYVKHSDVFSITTKVPTWAANNSVVEGISLSINYNTNMLPYQEQAVIG